MKPGAFTLRDEQRASPVYPLPRGDVALRIATAKQALASFERSPDYRVWNVLYVVSGFMVSLVALGLAEDPDLLLKDAIEALEASRTAAMALGDKSGATMALTPMQAHAVASVVEDFAECLPSLPARFAIRAMRRTERMTPVPV
jgi:hypothetical protein